MVVLLGLWFELVSERVCECWRCDVFDVAAAAGVFDVLFPLVAAVAAVVIDRVPDDICDDDGEPAADDALNADCARNAARKFARNGRFVDIFSFSLLFLLSSVLRRN